MAWLGSPQSTQAYDIIDQPPCSHDLSLARSAAQLAPSAQVIGPATLQRVLAQNRSDLPWARLWRGRGTLSSRSQQVLIRRLEQQSVALGSPLGCGFAQLPEQWALLWSIRPGSWHITKRHGQWIVAVAFDAASRAFWRQSAIFVQRHSGSIERHAMGSQVFAQQISIDDQPAVVRLQWVAVGPNGPAPIATRSLSMKAFYTMRESLLAAAQAPQFSLTDSSEHEVMHLVDKWRNQALGRGKLRYNSLLKRIAVARASRLAQTGVAVHGSKQNSPIHRLKRQHLHAQQVGEVAVCAVNLAAALQAIVDSPSHLWTLAQQRFTDHAVGISTTHDNRLCAVIVLATWPRPTGAG